MESANNSGNGNLTLGGLIQLVFVLIFIFAYYQIFNLVTGHYPRFTGRFSLYRGPGGWEGPLGFILGIFGGWFVRFICEKIAGRKL